MFRFLKFLIISIGLCFALQAAVQAAPINPGETPQPQVLEEQSKRNAQLQLARQLMASQDFQSAADILEVLYEADPANTIISNSLKSCYEVLKQYSKGELLLRRLVEQFPDNFSYKLNLAENLIHQGKLDDGKAIYNTLLADFKPDNSLMFTGVVRSMIECSLEDEALAIIEKLRVQFGDATLMAIEKAGILERRRNYGEATLEYFSVLTDSARLGNTAEKSLSDLLDFEESAKPTEKILLSKISVDSSGRALKVLSSYYLKTGRYDDAYAFAIRQDSAAGLNGNGLIQYLHGCMERKLYPQAVRISEYVINNIKNKPYVNEFYFQGAVALEELGNYDQAIKVYDTILSTFPREQDKGEAAYRIGKIYLDRLNQPQEALRYFDSVKTHYLPGFAYNSAILSIPYAYLQMGNIEQARQEFQNLVALKFNAETAEELDFHLALISLFEHQYDSCTVALKKLMVDYPTGFYVNDAVQLTFLIEQAGDAKDLLDNFAGALLFQQMKQFDSTVSRLNAVADADNKALADIALYRLTEIVLERGDSTGAVKYVNRLEADFADSYYLPYGLKTKADILLSHPESIGKGKEIYRRLLEDFPNYPFINEVREKLRKLETEVKPS